jgi:hypothetical protein
VLDHWQDVGRHRDDDVVSVGEGHQASERAVAIHAEAAAIVDDNEGDATGFSGFGGEADAFEMSTVLAWILRVMGRREWYTGAGSYDCGA